MVTFHGCSPQQPGGACSILSRRLSTLGDQRPTIYKAEASKQDWGTKLFGAKLKWQVKASLNITTQLGKDAWGANMHNHTSKEQINKLEFRSQAVATTLSTVLLRDLAHDDEPAGRVALSVELCYH